MERYYLAAKLLSQSGSQLSFEDYIDSKSVEEYFGKTNDQVFLPKKAISALFKFFDEHRSKIEFVGELAKEIPYIGLIMRLIRVSCGPIRWFS
jgi:hypothetical protein